MATLEQRIHSRNELNRLLHENIKHIIPQMESFVGKKIFLQDGSKSKAFNVSMSEAEPKKLNDDYCKVHYSSVQKSGGILILKISICAKDSNIGCFYTEDSIVFGRVDGGILESLDSIQQVESSYSLPKAKFTEAKVKANIEKIHKKEDELRDLKYLIRNFV